MANISSQPNQSVIRATVADSARSTSSTTPASAPLRSSFPRALGRNHRDQPVLEFPRSGGAPEMKPGTHHQHRLSARARCLPQRQPSHREAGVVGLTKSSPSRPNHRDHLQRHLPGLGSDTPRPKQIDGRPRVDPGATGDSSRLRTAVARVRHAGAIGARRLLCSDAAADPRRRALDRRLDGAGDVRIRACPTARPPQSWGGSA